MAERTLSAARFGTESVLERLRLLALGSSTGVVAGMGSFMFIKNQFIPWGLGEVWALVIIGVAGAYTHFVAADLSESIALSLVAFVVGIGFHVVAWIAPLWILPYPPFARDVLLPQMLGRALAGNVLVYVMAFYGSYFGAVTVAAYLEP